MPVLFGGKCFKHGVYTGQMICPKHNEGCEILPVTENQQPTWMDDNILVCNKHSINFTKQADECFVCTNRAPDARVQRLVEALDLATVRLKILTGRMRACGKHELLDEAVAFCEEADAALAEWRKP